MPGWVENQLWSQKEYYAWLGEDLVHGQGDHVLCLDSVDLMPLPVAELVLVSRLESGLNWSSSIVHGELDCPLVHCQHQVVPTTPHCGQDTRQVPRFDHHRDVEVEANSEPLLRPDPASTSAKEVAGLHLLRAGDHLVVLLPLRPQGLHPGLPVPRDFVFQVSETSNEALDVAAS